MLRKEKARERKICVERAVSDRDVLIEETRAKVWMKWKPRASGDMGLFQGLGATSASL